VIRHLLRSNPGSAFARALVMHSPNLRAPSKFAVLAIALFLATLWLSLHGYHGLTGDGQIYAFQAFARLHPQLAADLYLQNTSQDQFTLFSPAYARCIDWLGLENAARLLTLFFTLWLLAAAWSLVRALTVDCAAAWMAVAFLLIIPGDYGGSGVFQILEPFLTARLPAEALIITALACQMRGMKWLGLVLALGSLLIHPLVALPGLLLVICFWMPVRVGVIVVTGCVFATLCTSLAAINLTTASQVLTIMDAPWVDVVRERSQFLFLQLWSAPDWGVNALPFITLGLTAVVITDDRIRKLCAAAVLVGAAGLLVALVGGLIGPIAIFVQGQAWRWVWIAGFIGALLVPVTGFKVLHDERCGLLCSLLLVLGWTLPGIYGTACVCLALISWLSRARINSRLAPYYEWGPAALGIVVLVCISAKFWMMASPTIHPSGGSLGGIGSHDAFPMRIPAVLLGVLVWRGTRVARMRWVPVTISTMLIGLTICAFPAAFHESRVLGAATDIHEFAEWENIIPPTSTVLVTPPRDVGAFVWFTLGRPNYLALNQSSGVVFSRATSLEIRRRSEVLLPLMDPDWKILTALAKSDPRRKKEPATRPLTSQNLIAICADPQLGFVISPENVGIEHLQHEHAGNWKDWNLYDCLKVRSAAPPT
jgi:hypothetical protein